MRKQSFLFRMMSILVILSFLFSNVGLNPPTVVKADVATDAGIQVWPQRGVMDLWQFTPNINDLTIEIWDGTNLVKSYSVSTEGDGHAFFNFDEPLPSGRRVVVTDTHPDPDVTRELTLTDFKFTGIDMATKTFTGQAAPNTWLRVGSDHFGGQYYDTQADAAGNWSSTYSETLVTVGLVTAQVFPGELSGKAWAAYRPENFYSVDRQHVEVFNVPFWQDITVEVLAPGGAPRFAPVNVAGNMEQEGYRKFIYAAHGYSYTPGDTLRITAPGGVTMQAVLPDVNLTLTTEDRPGGNFAGGGALPNSDLVVTTWWKSSPQKITANASGDWSYAFGEPVDDNEQFEVYYETNNGMRFGLRTPNPLAPQVGFIVASFWGNWVSNQGWEPNSPVHFEIFESDAPGAASNFADDFTTDDGGHFFLGYDQVGEVEPGNYIVATGTTGQAHMVVDNIEISNIDYAANTVSGVGPAGRKMEIFQEYFPPRGDGNRDWRYEDSVETIIPANGHWSVNFSDARGGPYDLLPSTAIRVLVWGEGNNQTDMEYEPRFAEPRIYARLFDDRIILEGFPGDTDVEVSILNLPDPTALWSSEGLRTWGDGRLEINYDQHQVVLQPGNTITVSLPGQPAFKVMKIAETVPFISTINFESDPKTVTGTSAANAFIGVEVQNCFDNLTRADASGNWTYELHPWQPGCINSQSRVRAYVQDDNFNRTYVTGPYTSFNVDLTENTIDGILYTENSTVTITIRQTPGGTVLASDNAVPTTAQGTFLYTPPGGLTLAAGMEVEVEDNTTHNIHKHTVVQISLDMVDYLADTLQGYADPTKTIQIQINGWAQTQVTPNPDGSWMVNLKDAFGSDFDLWFDSTILVYYEDEDRDWTLVKVLPKPYLSFDPQHKGFHVERITPPFTLRIYDAPGGTVMFEREYDFGEGNRSEWDMPMIESGMQITLDDAAGNHAALLIRTLTIDPSADWAAGQLFGTSVPGNQVLVGGETINGWRWITADVSPEGNWSISTDPFVRPPQAMLCQSDGHCQYAEAMYPPFAEASLNMERIQLSNFVPNSAVPVKIYATPGAADPIDSFPIQVDQWGNGSMDASVDLQPGMEVEIIGTPTTYKFTLANVAITEHNRTTRVVRGTAPNDGKRVSLSVEHWYQPWYEGDMQYASGAWSLNYGAQPDWDIQGDHRFALRYWNDDHSVTRYDDVSMDYWRWDTLQLSLPSVRNLDPAFYDSLEQGNVINQIFAGLVKEGPDGTILPWLAQSWTVSADKRTYTFTLRSGLRWSDGTALTAQTAAESLKRLVYPDTNAPFAGTLAGLFNNPNTDITAPSATQLRLQINTPAAHLLSLLAAPYARPVPLHRLTTFGEAWTQPGNIVTSGAYRLDEWEEEGRYEYQGYLKLSKNPNYYDAANVQIPSLYIWLRNEYEACDLYRQGILHTASLPQDCNLEDFRVNQVKPMLNSGTYYLGFNTSNDVVNDARVRTALSLAVDRAAVIQATGNDANQPAYWFTPPNMVGAPRIEDFTNPPAVDNLDEAKLLLQAYIDMPGDSIDSADDISLEYWYNNEGDHNIIANTIIDRWQTELGITVSAHGADWSEYLTKLNSNDAPDIWRLGWNADYNDAANFLDDVLRKDAVWNAADKTFHWTSGAGYEAFEDKIDAARVETNPTLRRKLFADAEYIVVRGETVMMPLFHYGHREATQPTLNRTYGIHSWGHIADWRLTANAGQGAPTAPITVTNGRYTVTAPAGTFNTTARLVVQPTTMWTPWRQIAVSGIITVYADSPTTNNKMATLPSKTVTVSAIYTEPLPAGMVEDSAALYWYNQTIDNWQNLNGTLDKTANRVTAQVPLPSKESKFALFINTPEVIGNLNRQWIELNMFAPNAPIDLKVYDEQNTPIYRGTITPDQIDDDGHVMIDYSQRIVNEQHTPLKVGSKIEATQGNQTITAILVPLSVTGVDRGAETVSGTAPADAQIWIHAINNEDPSVCDRWGGAVADVNNNWQADFSGEENLDLNQCGEFIVYTNTTDESTTAYTWISERYLTVFEREDRLGLEFFEPFEDLTISYLNGVEAVYGPVDEQAHGFGGLELFYGDTGVKLEPGMVVRVARDGGEVIDFPVAALGAPVINAGANTVSGTTTPDTEVTVLILPENQPKLLYSTRSEADGSWEIDIPLAEFDLLADSVIEVYVAQTNGYTQTDTKGCHSLTVNASPINGGAVSAWPAPNCAGDTYHAGADVRINANPNAGFNFNTWSGDTNSNANPVWFPMDRNWNITANFALAANQNPASAPALSGPADKAVFNNQPTLSWGSVAPVGGGVTHYELQISDVTSFSSTTLRTLIIPATSSTTVNLSDNSYYWRVRALNSYQVNGEWVRYPGPWSLVRSFTIDSTAPAVPVLLTPADAAVTNSMPAFNWSGSTDSASYRFCLQTTSTPAACAAGDTYASTATSFLPGGKPAATYYWKVQACDTLGNCSVWSATRSLTVQTLGKPAKVTISSPSAGAVFSAQYLASNAGVPVAWAAAPNAEGYVVQWSTSPTSLADNSSPEISDTTYTIPTGDLDEGTIYYRVAGTNSVYPAGSADLVWSDVRAMLIDRTAPFEPIAVSPLDNTSVTGSPVLTWDAPEAKYYHLWVYANANAGLPPVVSVMNLTANSFALPPLASGMYGWRVQAGDAAGNWSAISAMTRFTITEPIPGQVTLTAPADKVLLNANPVYLVWYVSDYATGYITQLSTSATFATISAEKQGTSTVAQFTLPDGLYYWRVRAVNGNNLPGPWSAVRSLTVDTTAPVAPVVQAPLQGATTPGTPQFRWGVAAGATKYNLNLKPQGSDTWTEFTGLTAALYKPAPLAPFAWYVWRVQACDAAGNCSPWSAEYTFYVNQVIPGKPVLTAPVNAAVLGATQASAVKLTWNKVNEAAYYRVELSPVIDFSSDVQTHDVPGLEQLILDLYQPGENKYYWRVTAFNADDLPGLVSAVSSFTIDVLPPAAPLQKTPLNNAVFNGTPTFIWNPSLGAKSYQFSLFVNGADPTTPVALSPVLAVTSYKPVLSEAGNYQWSVRAADAAGNWSDWSTPWDITINAIVPTRVVQLGPKNNAYNTSLIQEFTWNPAAYADFYKLEVSANTSFNDGLFTELEGLWIYDQAYTLVLPADGKYYWRVTACNGDPLTPATLKCSPASTVFILNVDSTPPAAPVLTAPLDGATFIGTPTYRWGLMAGVKNYDLTITGIDDLAYRYDALALTTTSHKPAVGQKPGFYEWTARACDIAGNCSAWAEPYEVEVLSAIPATPLLTAPLNKAVMRDIEPLLRWNAVLYAEYYNLEVSNLATFPAASTQYLVATAVEGNVQSYQLVTIDPDKTYYWRVSGCHDAGGDEVCGAKSAAFSFTIDTQPPAKPNLLLPAANAVVRGLPTFTWQAPAGAKQYELQVFSLTDPGNLVLDVPGLTTTSFRATNLPPDQYYWRVNATDAVGNSSEFSDDRNLTVNPLIPVKPVLTGPANRTISQETNPVFTWGTTAYAVEYEMQVSNNATFSGPTLLKPGNLVQSFTALTNPTLNAWVAPTDGIYYWRVRVINSLGEPGAYSTAFTYTVDTTPPPAIAGATMAPVNNAVFTGIPTFTWRTVLGATRYNFVLSENPGVSNPLVEVNGLPTLSYKPPRLAAGVYYWAIQAVDAAGNTAPWSPINKITIQ